MIVNIILQGLNSSLQTYFNFVAPPTTFDQIFAVYFHVPSHNTWTCSVTLSHSLWVICTIYIMLAHLHAMFIIMDPLQGTHVSACHPCVSTENTLGKSMSRALSINVTLVFHITSCFTSHHITASLCFVSWAIKHHCGSTSSPQNSCDNSYMW